MPSSTKTLILSIVVPYGLAVAGGAFVLQWLEYRHATRYFSTEVYIVVLAVLFSIVGAFAGYGLTRTAQRSGSVERNVRALDALGISRRETEVLDLLAQGHTNQEIADALFVSANTVKTHLKNLYGKLEVCRRTQAVRKARDLNLLP